MHSVLGVTRAELDQVRDTTNLLVPGYDVNQNDPQLALDFEVGNCFTKAMVGAGILAVRFGVDASTVYSTRLLGSLRSNGKIIKERVFINKAHIFVLVPERDASPEDILGLDFNHDSKYSQGEIIPYNSDDSLLAVVDSKSGSITPTAYAQELGLKICDWREGASDYPLRISEVPVDPTHFLSHLQEVCATRGV